MTWLIGIMIANFSLLIRPAYADVLPLDPVMYAVSLICSFILLLSAVFLLLKVRKQQIRLVKTMIAYFGTEILLNCIGVLMVLITGGAIAVPLFMMVFIAWNFSLKAFILKHSLNTQTPIAVILAINLELLRFVPFMVIFFDVLTTQQPRMM
jgi:hypothetical protein